MVGNVGEMRSDGGRKAPRSLGLVMVPSVPSCGARSPRVSAPAWVLPVRVEGAGGRGAPLWLEPFPAPGCLVSSPQHPRPPWAAVGETPGALEWKAGGQEAH